MSHLSKAKSVLSLAVREATRGYPAASGAFIRQRVESCLSTALAMCKEDTSDLYKMIDEARGEGDGR